MPHGLLDAAPARFVPGRRNFSSAVPDSLRRSRRACILASGSGAVCGAFALPSGCLPPPGSRAALARCVAARFAGRVTRCVPGRFPGPLRSAGTDRFAGAPHSAPVWRWASRWVRGAVARPDERSANRGAPGAFRPGVLLGAASVVVGVVLGAAVRRLRSQPALATSGWGPCSARCVAGPVAGRQRPRHAALRHLFCSVRRRTRCGCRNAFG